MDDSGRPLKSRSKAEGGNVRATLTSEENSGEDEAFDARATEDAFTMSLSCRTMKNGGTGRQKSAAVDSLRRWGQHKELVAPVVPPAKKAPATETAPSGDGSTMRSGHTNKPKTTAKPHECVAFQQRHVRQGG